MNLLGDAADNGSSPLTRGKPRSIRSLSRARRLIPAHAGKTRSRCSRSSTSEAHPRSRGENLGPSARCRVPGGSSPLTRGKRGRAVRAPRRARLIPAHAGKTAEQFTSTPSIQAHPRSRGENGWWQPSGARFFGSSPLTRGKLPVWDVQVEASGLIPAHAGKTLC